MTPEPEKTRPRKPTPLILRTLSFGLMIFLWWVMAIELPWRNLSAIVTQRGVQRAYHPLSIWAFQLSDKWAGYRTLAVILIVAAMVLHYFLWIRYPKYDVYGRWLFRAGFLVLYILLYAFFFIMFVGAELPIWMGL